MGSIVVNGGRTQIAGKSVVGGLGVLGALVVGVAMAYSVGLLETLGYESRSLNGNGLTSTKSGYSFGLQTWYFTKGQRFFAEYDGDIRSGALIVHLYKFGSMPTADTPYYRTIDHNGTGTVTFPIQESGLYRITFSGSVLGAQPGIGQYDLTYQMRWGVR